MIKQLLLAFMLFTSASTFGGIAEKLLPISVEVRSEEGVGSGVVIRRGGTCYILTAAHVVKSSQLPKGKFDAVAVCIPVYQGALRVGRMLWLADVVRYSDDKTGEDLALLQVRKRDFVNTLTGGVASGTCSFVTNDVPPGLGDRVYHVGSFKGDTGYNSFSEGIVSSVERPSDGHIFDQVSCAIFPGSSGGGVFTSSGSCIGIVVGQYGETFSLVVPVRRIRAWAVRVGADFIFDDSAAAPLSFLSGPMEEHPTTKQGERNEGD